MKKKKPKNINTASKVLACVEVVIELRRLMSFLRLEELKNTSRLVWGGQ